MRYYKTGWHHSEIVIDKMRNAANSGWFKNGYKMSGEVKEKMRNTLLKKSIPPIDRFWAKVKVTKTCWVWQGAKNSHRYGLFSYSHEKLIPAHRFSWELHFSPIPPGMLVCHHCDNPPCINPKHLFLGTPKDNAHDCINKGRWPSQAGSQNPQSKLSEKQVKEILNLSGKYTCRYVARIFSVSSYLISLIWRRKRWKHVLI